jgi:hypothetical protein
MKPAADNFSRGRVTGRAASWKRSAGEERRNAKTGEMGDSSQRLVHLKKSFAIASDVLLDSRLSRATIVSVP